MPTALDGKIRVLPQSLAEKIAAGEVIERPSSIVKELVENALDAAADRISVDIEDAGYALIQVSDNGEGILPDDLPRAVCRHATSKISSLDDLYSLHTMGFRGEALASIAAVSRLSIESSPDSSGLGNRLTTDGGSEPTVRPVSRASGTTVCVRDLFYNTPARKKFMKTRRGERMHLTRVFEQLIVPFPSVHFTLRIDGQPMVEAPPVGTVAERVSQFAGVDFAAGLIACSGDIGDTQVTLLLGHPDTASSRPRFQDLYVNLRRVDNDSITFALRNACRPFYPGDTRPAFFAFLDIDPERVDVNIHPTKQTVKFDNDRQVAGAINRLIERCLREQLAPITQEQGAPQPIPQASASANAAVVREPSACAPAADPQTTLLFPSGDESTVDHSQAPVSDQHPGREDSQGGWDLISCYQIHSLFILAPIKNGILLVDQHAAHERVLFEQALDDLEHGAAASQQLLFPVVIELSASEKSVLMGSLQHLGSLGFHVEDFGGAAVSVSAIPAFLRDSQIDAAVREMIEYLLDETTSRHFTEPQKRYAAAFACGAAIKAGQELTREEMSALLNSLFATKNPYTCPHGRPTVTRMSLEELRRRFLR